MSGDEEHEQHDEEIVEVLPEPSAAPPPPRPRRSPPYALADGRRLPRPPARPVDITYIDPSLAPRSPSRNSLYHAQKALMSPRVLAALAIVGGWVTAGAQYVSGSARQSDLQSAVQRLDRLTAEVEQVKINSTAALTGAQQCVQQQGAQALAMRAIVGQIARQRGRSENQKRNEQAAAESRYSTAITDGKPPHEAARIALFDQ